LDAALLIVVERARRIVIAGNQALQAAGKTPRLRLPRRRRGAGRGGAMTGGATGGITGLVTV